MAHYSTESRDQRFVKGYEFLSFAKNMDKNIGKNLRGKYTQKLLDHAKQSATDTLKSTSKRVIQKAAEATGDLIDNKIADKVTKISRTSSQATSAIVKRETKIIGFDRKIPKERYITPEKRHRIIHKLRLI